MTQQEYVYALAAVPWGIGMFEVEGMKPRQVKDVGRRLTDMGLVTSVGYRQECRYFADPEAAQEYERELPNIKRQKYLAMRRARHAAKRARILALRPPKPVVEAKPAKPEKAHKKPAWSKEPPSVKFGKPTAGISIPRYTGQKWDKGTPAIIPPHVKITVCPSPPAFGPAAKLLGLGA